MSTTAPALIKKLAADWETKTGLSSAVCSGVVGDAVHRARGGYHLSRSDNPAGNYSIIRPDDRAGNGPDDAAAAIDMTMSTKDMITCTKRFLVVFTNPGDPRRKYLNAFNGWLGTGGAQRWDVYARKVKSATSDHEWHAHCELRRKYVDSATAMAATLSWLKGESLSAYLKLAGINATSVAAAAGALVVPLFPGVLSRNDKQANPDPNVKAFQARMIQRGWSSLGTPDGMFGPKLESVVKKFQALNGLTADGVIGARTWPLAWTRPVA